MFTLIKTRIKLVALVCTFFLVGNASAYEVIYDSASFASLYQSPTTTIDFSRLVDGSTFKPQNFNYSFVAYEGGSPYSAAVRDFGWSNNLLIGSSQLGCGCAWTATKWLGDSIAPEFYNRIYIATDITPEHNSFVVGLQTSIGFMGFVPSGSHDGYYLLPVGVSVTSLQYGFSAVQAVPEPETYAMLLAGLGLVGFSASRKTQVESTFSHDQLEAALPA